jgi:6-phosphofructokinase 1
MILENKHKGKQHFLIVTAEGVGGSEKLAKKIEQITGMETRATILGHLQRGGSPTAVDRMHASMMGAYAVDLLCQGKAKRVVAYSGGKYTDYDINEALAMKKMIDETMYEVSRMLS